VCFNRHDIGVNPMGSRRQAGQAAMVAKCPATGLAHARTPPLATRVSLISGRPNAPISACRSLRPPTPTLYSTNSRSLPSLLPPSRLQLRDPITSRRVEDNHAGGLQLAQLCSRSRGSCLLPAKKKTPPRVIFLGLQSGEELGVRKSKHITSQ